MKKTSLKSLEPPSAIAQKDLMKTRVCIITLGKVHLCTHKKVQTTRNCYGVYAFAEAPVKETTLKVK